LTATCADIPCFHQTGKPKLSGLELTALNLTAEFVMYNSEEQLFRPSKTRILKVKPKEACTIAGTANSSV
jgi:hypothetical protein